jgi:hypothetical protein
VPAQAFLTAYLVRARGAAWATAGDDLLHLFGPMLAGALVTAIGTVIQVVGLWRSHAVPRWVCVLVLVIVISFVVPGNGWIGLTVQIPMAAGGIAVAYYAWRRTTVV